MNILPILLSGGSGSRLWPCSRQGHPKQFMALTDGGHSLLQQTWQRLEGLPQLGDPLVIANEAHRFLVAEQLQEINITPEAILLEPMGRNTAPAITVAALYLTQIVGQDPVLLVLPADHLIQDQRAFQGAIATAVESATQGWLVTFGIQPTEPNTGYGYIAKGAAIDTSGSFRVDKFVEKPDRPTAEAYLTSGSYLWNSGMFVFRASTFLAEVQRWQPAILAACEKSLTQAHHDLEFIRLDATAFATCPADSIDYAVMEHTEKAAVVPVQCGWSDVGAWSSLWQVAEKDDQGNAYRGDVLAVNSKNCFVYASDRLVTLLGVEDLIVVETADALLVARQDCAQDVKRLVEELLKRTRQEALSHRVIYRPWGKYDSIDVGSRFQVKRITVKQGASLSLQKHHHRAEHWVVVSGTAEVTCNGEKFLLTENESTYIPVGAVHRLANPGKIPLEMIEIQSGPYLGEDDIVRFEDHYGRCNDETEG
ncbi:mannose-1-phosphate guanylyltransferase/mannose-6-phosphate isomerase [Candidatus Synechococcus calcipolaris G9]|uniref:mannose-1-phosphate guanylyltransferase n=1 Tax=Candidatus Synechococcus calcipolaris G9 TaxID=1497997 RepID=A0ABT6EU58_9SYNE|nr:mannose-1-phosphate guanylyltransferase/mannose-6-phosphate isomerase [Candidatus Synechococcus calcipolaris]MDG2989430.1 mannose-1-phosphate guanylyltransferase/mannose-6-phosphate isomerase [Candidatus Synechococcus calcipolaris G9]